MLNNTGKVDALINRAITLNPKTNPISSVQIMNMEEKLGVVFASDLKEIVEHFGFESLFIDCYAFYDDETNGVIPETLQLREAIGFPKDSVFLDQDDASATILKTMPTSSEPSPVYWIDITDLERYCEGIPLESPYQIFPSFTDFFEYLVTEAEKEAAEEKT